MILNIIFINSRRKKTLRVTRSSMDEMIKRNMMQGSKPTKPKPDPDAIYDPTSSDDETTYQQMLQDSSDEEAPVKSTSKPITMDDLTTRAERLRKNRELIAKGKEDRIAQSERVHGKQPDNTINKESPSDVASSSSKPRESLYVMQPGIEDSEESNVEDEEGLESLIRKSRDPNSGVTYQGMSSEAAELERIRIEAEMRLAHLKSEVGKGKANVENSSTNDLEDLPQEDLPQEVFPEQGALPQQAVLPPGVLPREEALADIRIRVEQAEIREHSEEMEEYNKNNTWEYDPEPMVKKETLTEEVNRILNNSKAPKFPEKVEVQLTQYRLVMETTILPEVERYSEKLGIHLEQTEAMTQRYEEHINKYAELLTKINESSRFTKILIGTATAFSIGYFIYKIALHRELPRLLSNGVSTLADIVNEMKIPSKLPTPSVPDSSASLISREWLHSPIVSPTELVLLGSVVGLGILVFRLALKVKRLINR